MRTVPTPAATFFAHASVEQCDHINSFTFIPPPHSFGKACVLDVETN